MKLTKNIKQIKGDASLRSFFRIKKKKLSSVIVFSKKDKRLNLLIYDAINKILIKNNILAPNLISENYSKNFNWVKTWHSGHFLFILSVILPYILIVLLFYISVFKFKEKQNINHSLFDYRKIYSF